MKFKEPEKEGNKSRKDVSLLGLVSSESSLAEKIRKEVMNKMGWDEYQPFDEDECREGLNLAIQKTVEAKDREFEKYEIEQLIPIEKDKLKFIEEQARADERQKIFEEIEKNVLSPKAKFKSDKEHLGYFIVERWKELKEKFSKEAK